MECWGWVNVELISVSQARAGTWELALSLKCNVHFMDKKAASVDNNISLVLNSTLLWCVHTMLSFQNPIITSIWPIDY